MTEERHDVAARGAGGAGAAGVRTGEAADMLRPAATRLGMVMTGQQVRGLVKSGDLVAVRATETGWRSISLESVIAYRTHLEQVARALEQAAGQDAERR